MVVPHVNDFQWSEWTRYTATYSAGRTDIRPPVETGVSMDERGVAILSPEERIA